MRTYAVWTAPGWEGRKVEILGFVKTDNTQAMAIVATCADGRVIEVRLHELRAEQPTETTP